MNPLPPPPPLVRYDPKGQTAEISDGTGRLRLRLDLANGLKIDRLDLGPRRLAAPGGGAWTGFKVGARWLTSKSLLRPPHFSSGPNRLVVSGVEYGTGEQSVVETWSFTSRRDAIDWTIQRRYRLGGEVEDSALPSLDFASLDTWTGARLGTGGVAWTKLLDAPNATYGVHTEEATFWKSGEADLLRLSLHGSSPAFRFTREPSGTFSATSTVSSAPLEPKVGLARFLRDRQDVWRARTVRPGEVEQITLELRAEPRASTFDIGSFRGLDTDAVRDMLSTIGRIGVIDEGLVGSNGWYSGYICMHEPWLARVGTALNDPAYQRSVGEFLDYAREHAVRPDGMVLSRWKYDAGDAQPGSYDPQSGFYEAQWGRLMDSQSSYVTNVADQFDLTGDLPWLRRQKEACERTLEYLLRRDTNGNGLVEMENDRTAQRRSSDWLDIVWASYENAFVNAQLYGALRKWAAIERLLGDAMRADHYEGAAHRLKTAFNRPIAEGGFWNPDKGWYVYWRDRDGSVHGDNLVVPINLTALGEGLCDDPARRRALLDTMERRMKAESLLAWPACFEGYRPGEGANDTFPTYENGDIFLAWAEYGVRAYAPTQPEVAVEHVRRILAQYRKDGLAYQRYLRKTGVGAGDDILANNVNVLTGLYRDVFGIQPKYNRLYLAPHLTSSLDGTQVRYDFRGERLAIDLAVGKTRVRRGNLTVESAGPFGVSFPQNGVLLFAGERSEPAVGLVVPPSAKLTISFGKELRIENPGPATRVEATFFGLPAGRRLAVVVDGRAVAEVSAARPSAKLTLPKGKAVRVATVERG